MIRLRPRTIRPAEGKPRASGDDPPEDYAPGPWTS